MISKENQKKLVFGLFNDSPELAKLKELNIKIHDASISFVESRITPDEKLYLSKYSDDVKRETLLNLGNIFYDTNLQCSILENYCNPWLYFDYGKGKPYNVLSNVSRIEFDPGLPKGIFDTDLIEGYILGRLKFMFDNTDIPKDKYDSWYIESLKSSREELVGSSRAEWSDDEIIDYFKFVFDNIVCIRPIVCSLNYKLFNTYKVISDTDMTITDLKKYYKRLYDIIKN